MTSPARIGFLLVLVAVLTSKMASGAQWTRPRPNIVFVLSDDLGWNDLSMNDPRVYSPNLQAIYDESLKLENYYVQATCTPSRAALMTGYYPMHLGFQKGVFRPLDPRSLPLSVPTLPELLQQRGYSTAAIGKWHLGYCDWKNVPTARGFDSFYGHYLGSSNYMTHERTFSGIVGHDFRDNTTDVEGDRGYYSTELFNARAVEVVENHDTSRPLFMYLAHFAPHSPIVTVKKYMDLYEGQFLDTTDKYKKKQASMVSAMDEGIGQLVQALTDKGIWNNTIFIFSSDNGGAPQYGGFNWPYRGAKGNHYEGGTKSIGFIRANGIAEGSFDGLFHITDWLPTLLHAADECQCSSYTGAHLPLDGFDQWDALHNIRSPVPLGGSPRLEVLYNVDETTGQAAWRNYRYKLVFGNVGARDGWFRHHLHMQNQTNVGPLSSAAKISGFPDPAVHQFQLFNLRTDPYEENDLSADVQANNPTLLNNLYNKLKKYETDLVPGWNPAEIPEASADNYGGVWTPGWCPDTVHPLDAAAA